MAVPICFCTFFSSCCAFPFRPTIAAASIKLAPSKNTIKSRRNGLRKIFLRPSISVSKLVVLLVFRFSLISFSQDLGRFKGGDIPDGNQARQQRQSHPEANNHQQSL